MVDMPISDQLKTRRPRAPTMAIALKQARLLLALVFLSSCCWIGVNEVFAGSSRIHRQTPDG